MVRALTLLAFLLASHGPPATAQGLCDIHASMTMQLNMKYGETRRASAMINPTARMEVWASDRPPYTWTILQVYPNGMACLVMAGKNFHADPPEPKGTPI